MEGVAPELLKELQSIKWEKNHYRPNVSGLNEELTKKYKRNYGHPCYSYTFGLIRPWSSPKDEKVLSNVAKKYPKLYQLLKDYIKELDPTFEYTHITANKNIVCQRHTDKYNKTPSLAIGLGDYTGGLLYVNEIGHDIRYKPLIFHGNQEHYTDAFEGERFSLIYYSL